MSYFVTGATGFIGQNLIPLLLKRRGKVYVLVRKGSEGKLDKFKSRWGKAANRVVALRGDLTRPFLQRHADAMSPEARRQARGGHRR